MHTIEKGQSLYSIAKMYNVTTNDIIRLNPGCDEKIYAGQAIKIPKGKESQKGETFHTIQAGETLYKLTTIYNISAKAICEANPGLSAENFRIGQVILIPLEQEQETEATQTPAEKPAIQGPVQSRCKDMHKVKRKETVFSVSREYGISEQELIAANPELKKGMKKGIETGRLETIAECLRNGTMNDAKRLLKATGEEIEKATELFLKKGE